MNIALDPVRSSPQRKFPQRHQITLAKEIVSGALRLLRDVHTPGFQARQQLLGGNIDQHHFIRRVEHRVRDGLPDTHIGDPADDIVQALEVLDVERGEDIDARRQQLLDILPALRMPRARRVGMRQLVDQNQRRMPLERAVQIEFGEHPAAMRHALGGQNLEPLEQHRGLGAAMRFDDADQHNTAGGAQRPGGGQHRVSLTHSRRGSEINPQLAALRLALLEIDSRQ